MIPIFSGSSIKNAQGVFGKGKEVIKATAKAYGAKAAGEFAKTISGSDTLGNLVTLGVALTHNLWPGSFKQNYDRLYNEFRNDVLKNPKAEGVRINPLDYNKDISKIERLAENYALNSPERNAFNTQIERIKLLAEEGNGTIDPEGLWNNIKAAGESARSAPDVVRGDIMKFIDVQKKMLNDFATKINPKGAHALTEANNLYRASMEAQEIGEKIASSIFPKQLSAGTAAFIMGANMPIILGLALGYKGGNQLKLLLENGIIQKNMLRLAESSLAGNITAANNAAKKIDKEINRDSS